MSSAEVHTNAPGARLSTVPAIVAGRWFTLVELLVIITIIAILVSMLLPGLQSAKQSAQRIQCTNNVRNLAMVWQFYHDENAGVLIPTYYGCTQWFWCSTGHDGAL